MSCINILPDHIANKIAAGEVVERPASVVKELLENAIDAGAETIRVELLDGGKGLIRVTDDGEGMSKEDLFLSVERHATSKITSEAGLESISTLGFRGEALPSIAAVSKLSITSRPKKQLEGYRLSVNFGKEKKIEPAGCPAGTCVEVEDLFLFLPARLRFLKTRQTETGHISQAVKLLSVGYPDICFELLSEGKTIFRSRKGIEEKDRLWPVLGDEITEKLIHVHGAIQGIKLSGYITSPEDSLSSSRLFYFFLNNRPITGKMLWKALNQAISGIFMKGTHAAGAIFLAIDPGLVDINVHPTKQEVRFYNTDILFRLIYHSIKKALEKTSDMTKPLSLQKEKGLYNVPGKKGNFTISEKKEGPWQNVLDEIYSPKDSRPDHGKHEVKEESTLSTSSHGLRVIGQWEKSYILAENEKGLVIIDQHAAHEAVLFARLKKRFLQGESLFSQPLLFPKIIETSPDLVSKLSELQPVLKRMGLLVEIFGPSQIIIKAKTDLIDEADACELLDRLLNSPVQDESDCLHDISAQMACKSAIKANHSLEMAEMVELINEIHKEEAFRCPHGRPIMQQIGLEEIEKGFGRR